MLAQLPMLFPPFFSYQAFSIDLYWKASFSLGLLSQGLRLTAHLSAVWSPLGVKLGGVQLCGALHGLRKPVFPLKGWQRPFIIRQTGNLSVQDNNMSI